MTMDLGRPDCIYLLIFFDRREIERVLQETELGRTHPDFRLFFSTAPHRDVPLSLMLHSIKGGCIYCPGRPLYSR